MIDSWTHAVGRVPLGRFRGAENSAFTLYLRASGSEAPPPDEDFDAMWHALRGALIAELRRRSLWFQPPSFLGVYGWSSWDHGERGGALEELLTDCYSYIFLRRLPRLQEQLRTKTSVDGLVFLYLRNFVHDRQKDCDPLGFRIFGILRNALREAVSEGDLHVIAGAASVLNSTVLATDPDAAVSATAPAEVFTAIVSGWNDDFLGEMVTARGPSYRKLVIRLRHRFSDLAAAGVAVFRCKHLIDALKADVRARWAALYNLEEGDTVAEDDVEATAERDGFQELKDRVGERIDQLDIPARSQQHLKSLWQFLSLWAVDEGPASLPSNRKLERQLRIPRQQFPALFQILNQTVRGCQAG